LQVTKSKLCTSYYEIIRQDKRLLAAKLKPYFTAQVKWFSEIKKTIPATTQQQQKTGSW